MIDLKTISTQGKRRYKGIYEPYFIGGLNGFLQTTHKQRYLLAVFAGEVFHASKYENSTKSPTKDIHKK
jgi:hypothetical protein